MIGLILLLLVGAGAWSLEAWLAALRAIARAVLAPFMIHELFPSLTETASGSHPCCVVSVTYDRTSYFHGGNTGSNPVGDAKPNQPLPESPVLAHYGLRYGLAAGSLHDRRCASLRT